MSLLKISRKQDRQSMITNPLYKIAVQQQAVQLAPLGLNFILYKLNFQNVSIRY